MPSDGDRLDELAIDAVADEVFLALADRERRLALYYLRGRDEVDVATLADVVTGWSNAAGRGIATREDRDRVHTALHARHLPRLDDAGLVDYDDAAGTVGVREFREPVRLLVDFAYRREGDPDASD